MSDDGADKRFEMSFGCLLIALVVVIVALAAFGLLVQGEMEIKPEKPAQAERVQ